MNESKKKEGGRKDAVSGIQKLAMVVIGLGSLLLPAWAAVMGYEAFTAEDGFLSGNRIEDGA